MTVARRFSSLPQGKYFPGFNSGSKINPVRKVCPYIDFRQKPHQPYGLRIDYRATEKNSPQDTDSYAEKTDQQLLKI